MRWTRAGPIHLMRSALQSLSRLWCGPSMAIAERSDRTSRQPQLLYQPRARDILEIRDERLPIGIMSGVHILRVHLLGIMDQASIRLVKPIRFLSQIG
jgi:hypothetical protein